MQVPYEYYRTFYYVARCQNLTAAAQLLHSSQPNVSRTIKNLEDALGAVLFQRSHRGVALTPAGEKLFAHVAAAVEELQAAEAALASQAGLSGELVTLGASENALHSLLPQALGHFHRDYPQVRLRVLNHTAPQAMAALKAGQIDFAVISTPTGAHAPLEETRLLPYRELAICGRALSQLTSRPHSLAQLSAYPLVALGRDSGAHTLYSQLYREQGLPFEPAFETATSDQVLPLVAAGLGVGFAPQMLCAAALARGEVLQIPLTEPLPLRHITLVEDKARPLGPAAARFREYLLSASGLPR